MGRFIIKLIAPDATAYYLEWSTISDAPVTYGMSLAEFRDWYCGFYGTEGYRDLEYRLARVAKYGTSSIEAETPEQMIIGNRAGPNETTLTMTEIIAEYCQESTP